VLHYLSFNFVCKSTLLGCTLTHFANVGLLCFPPPKAPANPADVRGDEADSDDSCEDDEDDEDAPMNRYHKNKTVQSVKSHSNGPPLRRETTILKAVCEFAIKVDQE
jgi:hypothetical protein